MLRTAVLRCAVLNCSCMQQTGRLNDARWHLQNGTYAVPTGAQGLLDIFMIDTNPMIPRYQKEKWWKNAGAHCIATWAWLVETCIHTRWSSTQAAAIGMLSHGKQLQQ